MTVSIEQKIKTINYLNVILREFGQTRPSNFSNRFISIGSDYIDTSRYVFDIFCIITSNSDRNLDSVEDTKEKIERLKDQITFSILM